MSNPEWLLYKADAQKFGDGARGQRKTTEKVDQKQQIKNIELVSEYSDRADQIQIDNIAVGFEGICAVIVCL